MKEFEVTPKDTEVVIRQLPTSRLEAMGCSDIPKGRMHIVVLEQDSEKKCFVGRNYGGRRYD